ncbi:MAG: 2-amino-4-hydroxy-6-hydroxymethyldihydropteridine diphosphokinase [Flavobacteriales bacterium]|jgi:2-amino-4-hydroxy-6-hydroxymethyldihydropteridine diphosphokinase|nr:2-amino-4-hydroxy-6-hydroxymethyldihydropteridine diphosphokinase [Flavobacteriales bacterium]
MKRAVLLLGSNLGNRAYYISNAIQLLAENSINIVQQSSVYESPADGYESSNTYYNIALEITTDLSDLELLQLCLDTEQTLSRTRSLTQRYTDRTIDIDIILIENKSIQNQRLTVPHPRMHERLFCLIPLNEIVPHWNVTTFQKTVKELLQQLTNNNEINQVNVEL